MTTTTDILRFLDRVLINPVNAGGDPISRKRVRFARMCLRRLPARSAIVYCIHGGTGTAPNRIRANDTLEAQGFSSFRELLPDMEGRFADVWPSV